MIIYLIIVVLLSLSLLFSLKYCFKEFDKLELIGLFFFYSGMNQQIFYFFSSTFKFVELVEEHLPLTILRMDYSIISPSLLIWTLYFIRRAEAFWEKVLYSLIWSAVVILIQRYEISLGVLMDRNWTLQHEIIKRLVIVALAYTFMKIWHTFMKKDRVIA